VTPVVVLVTHHHVGVGIARSLGRLGVPVYGIDRDRFSPMFYSRFCRGRFIWDVHREPVEATLAFLKRVADRIGCRALLIPTSDVGAMLVAEHSESLAEKYIFPRQPAGLVKSLCSKRDLYYLAKRCAVPTPEAAFPVSRTDVLDFISQARFPILVKPIYNLVPGLKPWRMILVHSPQELMALYDSIDNQSRHNVMLQEYIPGGDEMTWTFNGYFDTHGDCLAACTGRKLRNFPAYFGQASLAVCANNDHVKNATVEFMRRIGYVGALDLGYRYDTRDGSYKVNDVNPRIGAMFRLFVDANGVDVVRTLYWDLTGQTVEMSAAPEGRKWIVEDFDLAAAFRYWRDRKLTVVEWLRSLSGIKEMSFVCADDPLPALAACMMDINRRWSERRKLFRRDDRRKTNVVAAPLKPEARGES
jgi:predicted ATP-grasp superfamily ATP-dependent carboligase